MNGEFQGCLLGMGKNEEGNVDAPGSTLVPKYVSERKTFK